MEQEPRKAKYLRLLKRTGLFALNATFTMFKILNWAKPFLPKLIGRFPMVFGWLGPVLRILSRFNFI